MNENVNLNGIIVIGSGFKMQTNGRVTYPRTHIHIQKTRSTCGFVQQTKTIAIQFRFFGNCPNVDDRCVCVCMCVRQSFQQIHFERWLIFSQPFVHRLTLGAAIIFNVNFLLFVRLTHTLNEHLKESLISRCMKRRSNGTYECNWYFVYWMLLSHLI